MTTRITFKTMTPEIEDKIIALYNKGKLLKEISEELKISRWTIHRTIHRLAELKRLKLRQYSVKRKYGTVHAKIDVLLDKVEMILDVLEEREP